jgi:hypothetical protein
VRKEELFAIIMLILTLTLLPTASVVAPGPTPKEKAEVTVYDDNIYTDGAVTLNVRRAGRLVIVYGLADLKGTVWDEFEDGHQLGIRIDKSGETEIIYTFGTELFEDEPCAKFQLEGFGTWSGKSVPYGTVTVTDKTFTIYELFYERTSKKNGKGAIGVTYVEVGSGLLSFTVEIDSV